MGLLEAVKTDTPWKKMVCASLVFTFSLFMGSTPRLSPGLLPSATALWWGWVLWWGAPVTLLVWLFSQMIELSWLPDAGFCHLSSTDVFTKNCVLLALGIYTVNLQLKYWVVPRDMPVFQGDNLEVSLSPLPMRGGEGEEQTRTCCERWQDLGQERGNTVETVYLLVESWFVLKVFVVPLGPFLPHLGKNEGRKGIDLDFRFALLCLSWMTSGHRSTGFRGSLAFGVFRICFPCCRGGAGLGCTPCFPLTSETLLGWESTDCWVTFLEPLQEHPFGIKCVGRAGLPSTDARRHTLSVSWPKGCWNLQAFRCFCNLWLYPMILWHLAPGVLGKWN